MSDRPQPEVDLLEGISTTRTIRRYTTDLVPEDALRTMMFAATRAPSGSNRQPFRMLVLTDGPRAIEAKRIIGGAARAEWSAKRARDSYDTGTGTDASSPKSRMARVMQGYVDEFESVPVLVLPCLRRHREPNSFEGASIYPAVQNLLLAAHALGYGGALTGWHLAVEAELRELLAIPDDVFVAGTVTIGKPAGAHGPVRRRPLRELVYSDTWGASVDWDDPPGTRFTSAGPPPR